MDRILREFSGVCIRRVIDHSNTFIPEHAHDWPVLSLFVMGSYANKTEVDDVSICGPSAVLYRAGAPHRNIAGDFGFEQLEIEFDLDWLGRECLTSLPVVRWNGGQAAQAARTFLKICRGDSDESAFRDAMRSLIYGQRTGLGPTAPSWANWMDAQLRNNPNLRIRHLAGKLELHPSYVGSAFRKFTGESAAQVTARVRTEQAAKLLRETETSMSDVAAEVGFCDQSHLIRTFGRVLGRSPSEIRDDRQFMRRGIQAS